MKIYTNKTFFNVSNKDIIGQGGEAIVYQAQNNTVVKVYHKDQLTSDKQNKIKNYPSNLPSNVISPTEPVYNGRNQIIGYIMNKVNGEEFYSLSNTKYKIKHKINQKHITEIFTKMLDTLYDLHNNKVIVGDYNDMNFLFNKKDVYFIDTDSYQFSNFYCTVGTETFLDPYLYNLNLEKEHKYTELTDYYSFATMLFHSLLNVLPYGGVHKQHRTYIKRAENKISVFDKDVKLPKIIVPFETLPTSLLDYFHKVFVNGERSKFDKSLLDLDWKKCKSCKIYFAGEKCICGTVMPGKVIQTVMVNKTCKKTTIFTCKNIIRSDIYRNKIVVLYDNDGELLTNNNQRVSDSDYYVFYKGYYNTLGNDGVFNTAYQAELLGKRPVVSTTDENVYFINNGNLCRGDYEVVDSVVSNNTWIECCKDRGFGFYRLSEDTTKYFIFKDGEFGVNYIEGIPSIKGRLVNAKCYFSGDYVSFLYTVIENGKKVKHLHLIKNNDIISSTNSIECPKLLKRLSGKCMLKDKILTATDDGLLLCAVNNGKIYEQKLFQDTEPFIDYGCDIYAIGNGVTIVNDDSVFELNL
jgi:H/ACA ribonucleoprotein complex subunit 3